MLKSAHRPSVMSPICPSGKGQFGLTVPRQGKKKLPCGEIAVGAVLVIAAGLGDTRAGDRSGKRDRRSVQQQPIAAPEGSEINHGIHRNTRKRESESTSPFRVLPGGGPTPAGWGAPPVGWGRSVVTRL